MTPALAAFALVAMLGQGANGVEPPCALLLLTRTAAPPGVALTRISMAQGQVRIFPVDSAHDNVAIVLPWGRGQSGDLAQLTEPRLLITRCSDGAVTVTVRRPDGRTRDLPRVAMSDLAAMELRVNVSSGAGARAVFLASGDVVTLDTVGPILDAFEGQVPLGPLDYAVTTEVSERPTTLVTGEAVLHFASGYFYVDGRGPDGATVSFVLDFGASATTLARSALPAGAAIRPLSGTEYSAKGARTVHGGLGGAGGGVEAFLGVTSLPEIRIGGLRIPDITVNVVTHLSDIGGQPVAGIIGLDVLRRAGTTTFEFPSGQDGVLRFGAPGRDATDVIDVPLAVAGGHVFLMGWVGSTPVAFILDTGSPDCYLSPIAAHAAALPVDSLHPRTIRGLDETPIAAYPASPRQVRLGARDLPVASMWVADLPVLKALGLASQPAGLLGNSLWGRLHSLEFDWTHRRLRLRP
jgi:predicted aspartyl protease